MCDVGVTEIFLFSLTKLKTSLDSIKQFIELIDRGWLEKVGSFKKQCQVQFRLLFIEQRQMERNEEL